MFLHGQFRLLLDLKAGRITVGCCHMEAPDISLLFRNRKCDNRRIIAFRIIPSAPFQLPLFPFLQLLKARCLQHRADIGHCMKTSRAYSYKFQHFLCRLPKIIHSVHFILSRAVLPSYTAYARNHQRSARMGLLRKSS